MSEMRRTARALVETRTERFESRHGLAASQARLAESMARARPAGRSVFTPAWSEDGGRAILDATFAPPARTGQLLKGLSIGMALALGASAWAVATQDGATAFLLPLFTVLASLALPFVALGLGSQREAEEARIRKAIRVALLDEEERLPPRQRWADEEGA
jgi:hypothetical protein